MRRIKEMQENGVTIFFVSHDPSAVRALCSRAILLNAGRMEADGSPLDVLNRYQKIIMARQEAYAATEKSSPADDKEEELSLDKGPPLRYLFRHGDKSAEIQRVDLFDVDHRPVELVESGEQVLVRTRFVANDDLDDVVCGFLIRNRHGIHVYGTNTELQGVNFERVNCGEVLEVTFAFNCWLASDLFSLTVAVHNRNGTSFDWLDGVLFFRVMTSTSMEGLANLNATTSARRLGRQSNKPIQECAIGKPSLISPVRRAKVTTGLSEKIV
jgi:hypothetical protein